VEFLGIALYWIGAFGLIGALIWSFAAIAEENRALAVICLFLPMGLLVVLIMKFPKTWRPLAAWAVALVVMFCGIAMRRAGE
jgi:hypothetical protein